MMGGIGYLTTKLGGYNGKDWIVGVKKATVPVTVRFILWILPHGYKVGNVNLQYEVELNNKNKFV